MKRIILREGKDGVDSKVVLRQALENGGAGGMGFAEMRKRQRVLDAIDKVEGDQLLKLEDADWETLRQAMDANNSYQRVPADFMRFLVQVADDVQNPDQERAEKAELGEPLHKRPLPIRG